MPRPQGLPKTEEKFDVLVRLPAKDSGEKIWVKQTGEGNRWGNVGFSKEKADQLVQRLTKLGVSPSDIKVKPHPR